MASELMDLGQSNANGREGRRLPFSHLWEAISEIIEDIQALGVDPDADEETKELTSLGKCAGVSILMSPFGSSALSVPWSVVMASAGGSMATQLLFFAGGIAIVVSVVHYAPMKRNGRSSEEDQDALQAVHDAKTHCLATMKEHLDAFLARPENANTSYDRWVAEFHPEDVSNTGDVDHRHFLQNSEHRRMWNANVNWTRVVPPRNPPSHRAG
mmetsp:Transcript_40693/g.73337  ORF Transcript_40693/g.73337 Transcript_40693/m.73337 type:complete len:213 (-) Transcript_40693:345-983(-)